MDRSETVRAAMRAQADFCRQNDSPITARICAALADVLDAATETGRRALAWQGDPIDDALPLRLAGALHALHHSGRGGALDLVYAGVAGDASAAVRSAIAMHDAELVRWLDGPPQTNEVGRAGAFMAGLLAIAHRFALPVELLEIGSSAGLNLLMHRFAYDLGGVAGDEFGSAIRILPLWRGDPPPRAEVRVVAARGVDKAPVDITAPGAADRLLAYVWADQPERLERTARAIALATAEPPDVEAGDAVDWLEARLAEPQAEGRTRVLMHSIVLQYLSDAALARLAALMVAAGAKATESRPLAWLSFESGGSLRSYELRLRMWPGGEDRLLARLHPHASWIEWAGGAGGIVTDSSPSWARPGAG